MKKNSIVKYFFILAAGICAVSCSDNDNGDKLGSFQRTYNVIHPHLTFDSDGAWTKADDIQPNNQLMINGADYSLSVNPARGTYYGFMPSQRNNSQPAETGADASEYGAMSLSYRPENPATYMNVSVSRDESLTVIPMQPSCKISLSDISVFVPNNMTITNNAATYKAMKELFEAAPAGVSPECKLLITGVYGGSVTSTVKVTLGKMEGGKFVGEDQWTNVNLSELGAVNYMYFQMESNYEAANIPFYFCMLQFNASYWAYN